MIQTKMLESVADDYRARGYSLCEQLFSPAELECIREEVDGSGRFQPAITVLEDVAASVRSVYGGYDSSPTLCRLVEDSRLVESAMCLLGNAVYVYQFKVNMKQAFVGDIWPWHQDFAFWRHLDGMREPDAVTAALFLDDVTEFNAPMFCLPRSHLSGLYQAEQFSGQTSAADLEEQELDVSSRLRFTLAHSVVSALVAAHGLMSVTAPRGSVFFFHPNLVHASGANLSPFHRRQIFITYNSIENALPEKSARPDYLVNPVARQIVPRCGPIALAQ
jgi:ectoine hydroxylase